MLWSVDVQTISGAGGIPIILDLWKRRLRLRL